MAVLVLVGFVVIQNQHAKWRPPLPPLLAAIQCPPASTDYAYLRLGSAGLLRPCVADREQLKRGVEGRFSNPGSGYCTGGAFCEELRYRLKPNGQFADGWGESYHIFPQVDDEVYALSVTYGAPAPPPPAPNPPPNPDEVIPGNGPPWSFYHEMHEVTVAVPAPFSGKGPITTFHCDGTPRPNQTPQSTYECVGYVDSPTLSSVVRLRFGEPRPENLDFAASITQALALVAAHVYKPGIAK